MPGYDRLVKVKARAKRWKRSSTKWKERAQERSDEIERLHRIIGERDDIIGRLKGYKRDATNLSEELSEYKNHAEESLIRLRDQGAEIKRLKALIIEKDKRSGLPRKYDEIRIRELEAENTQWREAINRQNADIQARQNRINELDTQLKAVMPVDPESANKKLLELEDVNAENQDYIHTLQAQIDNQTAKIKSLEDWLKSRDHTVYQLNERIKELQATVTELRTKLADRAEQKIALEQANSKLKQELAEKLQDIGEMGTTIASQTDSLLKAQNRNADLEQVILGLKKSLQVRIDQLKDIMPVDGETAGRQIRKLQDLLAAKDEELRTVVDREHRIHNESAREMIERVKELEFQVADLHRIADDRRTANDRLRDRVQELEAENTHLARSLLEVSEKLNLASRPAPMSNDEQLRALIQRLEQSEHTGRPSVIGREK